MATKPKKTARYDLKAADRKRNLAIQIGLTAIVVVVRRRAGALHRDVADDKPTAGEAKSIRVTSSKLITKEGAGEPKVVLSMYEDFLCPHCGDFEQQFGPTISKLIDTGAVAADYYMVGHPGPAAEPELLVARRWGGVLRGRRIDRGVPPLPRRAVRSSSPARPVAVYPDNARLIEIARQAGAGGAVPDCINKGTYIEMVQGMAAATGITGHPDRPHQRRGLRIQHARRAGRQDQGDRRRRSGP